MEKQNLRKLDDLFTGKEPGRIPELRPQASTLRQTFPKRRPHIDGKEKGKMGHSYHTKKKKIVGAVELTEDNYSGKELETIFKNHIDTEAKVETDGWKGYSKMKKKYNIKSTKSLPGIYFNEIHTVIQNLESWLWAIPKRV